MAGINIDDVLLSDLLFQTKDRKASGAFISITRYTILSPWLPDPHPKTIGKPCSLEFRRTCKRQETHTYSEKPILGARGNYATHETIPMKVGAGVQLNARFSYPLHTGASDANRLITVKTKRHVRT
jgi:hypothetical protein